MNNNIKIPSFENVVVTGLSQVIVGIFFSHQIVNVFMLLRLLLDADV